MPDESIEPPAANRARRKALELAIAEREIELAYLKKELASYDGIFIGTETQGSDLLEANAHLVLATLAAEHSEELAMATRRQQDEFLAMLAHELRNPLAPIRTSAALLERIGAIDPRLMLVHQVINRQVTHMARLLDDLLDASRITNGKVTLQRRPTAVAEFVMQAVEFCRTLIDAQSQQLSLDIPIATIHVDGDPTRLAQIVGNLLHNAAKYTPDGGWLALSVRLDGEWVVIKVADNGNGISQDAQAGIFELFTQEQRSLNRSQGGLGIGLTVVRRMVEQHGGAVSVHSEGLGQGSEFTVVLPRMQGLPELVTFEPIAKAAALRRVLVVDDNLDAGLMLSMLLELEGHEVQTASDGPGGLQSYAVMRPDVVVCDIGLPGMNGYEVAQSIRRTAGPQAVLVALTGYNAEADRVKALAAGFDRHFAKPVAIDELHELIQGAPSLPH